jgi:hypothetical protein
MASEVSAMTFINLVPPIYINVKQYGAAGDGITDDTAAITSALSAASGGGAIFFPTGTYLTGNQTLATDVHLIGAGIEATIIKLKNGANTDLFSANTSLINLSSSFGGGNTGGVYGWSIEHMTLDGNKANQSSGTSYILRFYGYSFFLNDLNMRNGYSGGVLCDWNGGNVTPQYQTLGNSACFQRVCIHDCSNIGLEMGGPHDSLINVLEIFNTSSHNLHLAPNAAGMQFYNVDFYGATHGNSALAVLNESSSTQFIGGQIAGSDTCMVYIAGLSNSLIGTRIFTATAGSNVIGIQLGQASGNTPYNGAILQSAGVTTSSPASGCVIVAKINNCDSTSGAIFLGNDGGNNVNADIFGTSPGLYISGNRSASSTFLINGRNLTADGTLGKSGGFIFQGAAIRSGTFAGLKSSGITSLSSGNTINTLGMNMVRVSQASGAVTGIILQQGSFDAQQVVVVNEGSNSVTFDVSGTSHVASGTAAVIAANTSRLFVYDSTTGLWY